MELYFMKNLVTLVLIGAIEMFIHLCKICIFPFVLCQWLNLKIDFNYHEIRIVFLFFRVCPDFQVHRESQESQVMRYDEK